MNEPKSPRVRTSFAKLDQPLPIPNLIDIQRASWDWFLAEGLKETIADISPIKDFSGQLLVEFGEYSFGEPSKSIPECRDKDMTYSAPLTMTVRFINTDTGEIREQKVFMGDFPMMTKRGTFIIHGTERVVVTQLVRSPGAYIMEPKQAEREKQCFVANLMPQRGSWLELEIDKKGAVNVRIDRKRKFPVTVLLRAMGYGSDDDIRRLFDDARIADYINFTIERDTTHNSEEALIELFRKQRPGEPPTLDAAHAMLHGLFFDPKRYDLSRVGRHKLNSRLHGHKKPGERPADDLRVLANDDIVELIRRLVLLMPRLGVRTVIEEEIDRIESEKKDLQNKQAEVADTDKGKAAVFAKDIKALDARVKELRALQNQPAGGQPDPSVWPPRSCPRLRRRGRHAAHGPSRRGRRRDRRIRALRQPAPAHRGRAGPGRVPHRACPHGTRHPRTAHHRRRGRHPAGRARQHPARSWRRSRSSSAPRSCRSSWTRRTRSPASRTAAASARSVPAASRASGRPSRCATCTPRTTAACAPSRRRKVRTSASSARSPRSPPSTSSASSARPTARSWTAR